MKSTTPVDEYVCTLDEDLLKYAEEALGETEEKRQNGIRELREWVLRNPRIAKCRLDGKYLLRFLRVTKHNTKRAKEMLERWLIFREGLYGYDWFSNLDVDRPNLQELMNKGLLIVLPTRTKVKKERVIIVRCQAVDPKTNDIGNIAFSLSTLVYETLHENEEDQIRGFRFIFDVGKINLSHYFIFSFNTWNRLMKHVERTCTNRNRGVHVVNMNRALLFVSKLVISQMKEKNRKKNHFHSDIDEIDFIDKKDLPREYGGEVPMSKYIGKRISLIN